MILMNDFKAEPQELKDEMLSAAKRVIDSGWYILGNELETFESHWALACGVGFGVGVGNGMDAIEIALRAIGIGPGDEVITTSMTAFASVLAILRAGAVPVLADIDPTTALLSIESVRRCISSKTRAILLVHLYGQMRDMHKWQLFCQEQGIYLVEDCAQAHLSISNGKRAGSFGIAGAYSFYPTKNLGALGDAGMLVTNNKDLAERATRLRNYGQSERYIHPELGLNSRLDEIQSAMLIARLKWLEIFTERRRQIALSYKVGIQNSLIQQLAFPEDGGEHAYHLYVITSQHRYLLQSHLQRQQIQTLIHYPIPVHHQEPFSSIKRDPQGLNASEKHSQECLSIPCHPQMSDADVAHVIHSLNNFCIR